MSQKTLFAGPWVGELGWELFCWHGFLRKLARKYDRVMIACREGHDLLYEDFATDIIHYSPPNEETDMWMNKSTPNLQNFHQHYIIGVKELQRVTVMSIDAYRSIWWHSEKWNVRQEFVPFGMCDGTTGFDVLMIVRNTNKCNTGFRNWPFTHAQQFANEMRNLGVTVACVGKSDSAFHIPGTVDCRDLPLSDLAQIMANSRVIVGPQCGPIHFASLCLLPQVCWQTKLEHSVRTKTHWNPSKIPVTTIPSNDIYWKNRNLWLPPIQSIIDATTKMLCKGV